MSFFENSDLKNFLKYAPAGMKDIKRMEITERSIHISGKDKEGNDIKVEVANTNIKVAPKTKPYKPTHNSEPF